MERRWLWILLTHVIILAALLSADQWLNARSEAAVDWLEQQPLRFLLALVNHFYRALGSFWVVVWTTVFLWRFDPEHRARLRVLVVGAILAGLLQGAISVSVGRVRPGKPRGEFGAFMPFFVNRTDDVPRSFPSGHTTVAFTVATYLALAYPRARGIVFLLASLCGLSRVASGDHYFGDVYAGALLGHYVTYACWVYAHRPGWQSAWWYRKLTGSAKKRSAADLPVLEFVQGCAAGGLLQLHAGCQTFQTPAGARTARGSSRAGRPHRAIEPDPVLPASRH